MASHSSPILSVRHVILYGLIALPFALIQGPGLSIVPNLYAQHFGISLTDMSWALFLVRLFCDAGASLAIGYLSDKTHSRMGRRKPWLAGGTIVGAIGVFQLYTPSGQPSIAFLSLWMGVVLIAWNMVDIPYTVWGNEVAIAYRDRSRISLNRTFFAIGGLLLLAFAPFIFSPTNELDFHALRAIAWVAVLAFPAVVLWAAIAVPTGEVSEQSRIPPFKESVLAIRNNSPYLLLLCASGLVNLGVSCAAALFFLFYTSYLNLGSYYGYMLMTSTLIALVSMPAWAWVLKRISKKNMLMIGIVGVVVQLPFCHLLFPDTPYILPICMAWDASWYFFYSAIDVANRATLGDVIDYDNLKTDTERAGMYTSIWSLTNKVALATGASLAFLVADLFGYSPSQANNDAAAIWGLKFATGGLPAIIIASAALFVWRFPISERRHGIIRRRIDQRNQRRITN